MPLSNVGRRLFEEHAAKAHDHAMQIASILMRAGMIKDNLKAGSEISEAINEAETMLRDLNTARTAVLTTWFERAKEEEDSAPLSNIPDAP